MDLPQNIKDEIKEYCRINNISNIDEFTIKMVRQGFTIEKFGSTPSGGRTEVVEKIVEKEIIKEVPVEKIVEKIIEVEVEKVVEKEVIVNDDEALATYKAKIEALENELAETMEILTESIKGFKEDRLAFSMSDRERVEEITKLEVEIDKLNETIKDGEIEKEKLLDELETEKAKVKKEDNDIYGESKQGFPGSNTMDIWKNRNK